MYVIKRNCSVVRDHEENSIDGGLLSNTEDAELLELQRKYLKSFAESPEEYADTIELRNYLEMILNQMILSFEHENPIPMELYSLFHNETRNIVKELSNDLMEKYQQALTGGATPDAGLEVAEDILLSGFARLSNVLVRYERELQVLKILQHHVKQGYTHYLFLCEKGQNSCERCESSHGKLMEMNELFGRHLVPPLHPNCRCELMCIDYAAAMVYTKDPERFLQNLETVIDRSQGSLRGGMYLLNADYASVLLGVTSAWKLERITDTRGGVLADLTKPFGYEAPFRLPNAPQDLMELLDLYRAAQEYRSAHKWDSFGAFLDWLTGGIPVGMWNSAVGRWDTMIENPSLLTVLNFLTLGTSGMVIGAIEPEEMLSLQHWLDMLGTALLVYGLYRSINNAVSVSDDILHGQSWYRSELTQEIIDKIVDLGRGNRPNPSTYLSKAYISTHLSYFQGGVTKIMAEAPMGTVGPPSGTFALPTAMVDDLIRQAAGDISRLEYLLGLPAGYLGTSPVRVDIPNPTGLRMPSGNERGANELWIPGGYTSGGIMEAAIDPVNSGDYTVLPIK